MSYPHRIRLRGPWECEPLACISASDAPLPLKCRMTLPARWGRGGLGDFAGRVRFTRRFGFPARLDSFERVWLTCDGVETRADIWLNGTRLGCHEGPGAFEFEVTSLLWVRNELVVEVVGPADRGGIWGEVALEVRCTAFLQDICVDVEGAGETARLRVAGRVAGTAERLLEIYVLLDGATVAYATVEAGHPFQLVSDERRVNSPGLVRVDLVNVATIWYQIEQFFPVANVEPGDTGGPEPGRAGD